MYSVIHADVETRSPVDLRKCGAFVYFAHPLTEVLMMAYRLDDEPIRMWTYGRPCPDDLRQAIADGAQIFAYNCQFETLAFDLLAERHGWPRVAYDRYVDTAASSSAMALPRALGDLGSALGLSTQKDKEGGRLIRKFSIPRRARKDEDPAGVYWNEPKDHPDDWQLFMDYCRKDVETEEEAAERMVPLSEAEQQVWLLDQKINRRGVRIDIQSARAAVALAEKSKALLDKEMCLVTGGRVPSCTQPAKLVEWVEQRGIPLNSAAKADITELLTTDDLPDDVRRALEIRQEAAKTSVSKLQAMLARSSSDGRVRGGFMYHGASTGRWVSTGVNLANLPRPRREFDDSHLDAQVLFKAIRTADPAALRFLYGDDLGRPLHLLSDAIRGFIWAAPGHDLVQADYSGIEGAVAAWVAGEDWKVAALHEIIADPSLPDLYRRTAASIMNTTTDVITKKHPLRQSVGKVSELALGFAGGVAAFVSMAKNYGVKLDPLFEPVWATADGERRERAIRRYESCVKNGSSKADVLSREAWLACEVIKVGWRASNPAIAGAWKLLEAAIREAIDPPVNLFGSRDEKRVVSALNGKVHYLVANGFLWCKLPSGRCLAYGSPKLSPQVWIRHMETDEKETVSIEEAKRLVEAGGVEIEDDATPKATALGVNSVTKKFERFALYGGLAFENVVQAIARDLLVNGMWKAEAAGYPIIAHVYDEIIAEVPRGFGDLAAFEKLICELPAWADGMPLTAGGWRGKRYRKD